VLLPAVLIGIGIAGTLDEVLLHAAGGYHGNLHGRTTWPRDYPVILQARAAQ
jgi:uncharacterized membrane protein